MTFRSGCSRGLMNPICQK